MLPKDVHDPICMIKRSLFSSREHSRLMESNMGSLFCDAMIDFFQCDVSIVDAGVLRGDDHYPPGIIFTKGMLDKEIPFPNKVFVVEITGKAFLDAIENGLSKLPVMASRFPQVSKGLSIEYDEKAQAGKRITKATLNNKIIKEDDKLKLATTEFIRDGGDGFSSLKNHTEVTHEKNGTTLKDIVHGFMKKQGLIDFNLYEFRVYKKGKKNLWKMTFKNLLL